MTIISITQLLQTITWYYHNYDYHINHMTIPVRTWITEPCPRIDLHGFPTYYHMTITWLAHTQHMTIPVRTRMYWATLLWSKSAWFSHMTSTWLSHTQHMTITWLAHNQHMTITWRSHDHPCTYVRTWIYCATLLRSTSAWFSLMWRCRQRL